MLEQNRRIELKSMHGTQILLRPLGDWSHVGICTMRGQMGKITSVMESMCHGELERVLLDLASIPTTFGRGDSEAGI